MSASNPPVNGVQYIVYIALQDMANPGSYKANPTIASGDVKLSIDGGAFANIDTGGTLPAVTPAAGIAVKVTVSATQMTGDNIFIQFIDQTAPKEWADYAFVIQTVRKAWLAPTTAGNDLDVSAGGEAGVDWANVGSPTTAVGLSGTTIATSQAIASVSGAVGSVTARVTANTDQWAGGAVPAPGVTGVPIIDLRYILGTILTETAGQIAAGFKKLFDVAAPVFTLLSVNQTGDSFARIGAAGAGLTALGDTRIANLDTTVTSRLAPTTAGRTLDVAATGEAGLDFDNIHDASGAHTLTNIRVPVVTLVDTLTTYTGNTPQTGDSFARIGLAGAGLTNIDLPNQTFDLVGNITGNLSGSVGSVTGAVGSVTGAVGSVSGNVGGNVNGNVVGSVGSVTADVGITQGGADKVWLSAARTLTSFGTLVADIWASAARTLTSFGTLTADVADKLLGRSLATGADGGRTVQDALRLLRNKRSIAAGTLTVTEEDDTTPAWTASVTTVASNPVNNIDPA